MKKSLVILLSALMICFVFFGCELEEESKEAVVSGDLAYYTAMDENARKDNCQGNYIEITGKASTVYQNIGSIYIGETFSDEVRFQCSFSKSEDVQDIEKGDSVTIRGKCRNYYSSTFNLSNCEIVAHTKAADTESVTGPASGETTDPTAATNNQEESIAPTTIPSTQSTTTSTTSGNSTATETTNPPATTPTPTTTPTTAPTTTPTQSSTTKPTEAPTQSQTMVWIPTKGGTKYHSRSSCSSMEDPEYVTKSEAVSRGFTACGRCY